MNMSRHKFFSCLAFSVVAAAFCWAQYSIQDDWRAADKRILQEVQEHNQLMENIEHLSDAIGPRLTGSEQLKTAEGWAASVARQYGLEDVHLEAWKIAHSWQRGVAQAQIVKPVLRTLTITSAGWSPSTNGLVRGKLVYVSATKPDELQAYKARLRGAIVIYDKPSELMSQQPASGPYDGPDVQAPQPPARRTLSAEERFDKERRSFLKGEGVATVLRDSGKHHALLSVSNVADDYDFRDALPTAMLTHEDYSLVWRLLQKGDVEVQIALTNSFSDMRRLRFTMLWRRFTAPRNRMRS